MLEAAADKIRYEVVEENDEDESEKYLENNRYRISEYDNQSLTNEQSASDKLREVESERERLSRLLRHAWEQEEEEEDDDEDDETRSDDDEDEKLRRAINRAQHLLESRHQISFAPPTSTMPLTSRKQSLRRKKRRKCHAFSRRVNLLIIPNDTLPPLSLSGTYYCYCYTHACLKFVNLFDA